MPRARNIKPAFFANEELSGLSPLARLLFVGLWCLADREGRLEDRPTRIKAQLLPYDRVNTNRLLDLLQEAAFILRYEVGGRKLIWIRNFSKHQNPHRNEAPSSLPPPTKPGAVLVLDRESPRTTPDYSSTRPADPLPPDSPIRIPDSPSADGDFTNMQYDDQWTRFIEDWPRQVNLVEAKSLWNSLLDEAENPGVLLDEIFAGKARYQISKQWQDGFHQSPANWLRKRLWVDSPPAAESEGEFWVQVGS